LIRVFSIHTGPRLHYILNIIFDTILGIEYEITEIDESFDQNMALDAKDPVLLYGVSSDHLICIPNQGLLFEMGTSQKHIYIRKEEITKVSLAKEPEKGFSIDFDIFSTSFYLITLYHNYYSPDFDAHGRHNEKTNQLLNGKLHSEPLIDIYAEYLCKKLKEIYPRLTRKVKAFDYKITFDIDSPYLYKYKRPLISAASLAKNLVRIKIKNILEQLNVILGAKDPYDVYDEVLKTTPYDKLLFFFLIDRKHHHDGRFTYKNKAYRMLIKRLSESCIETAIHPSYTSFKNESQIAFEKKQLELITGKPVKNSRMHFLKYVMPGTFNSLIKSSITDDYTLCPVHKPGFITFMARPFFWFNVEANIQTSLLLHPTMVMDRSLQKYMNLKPDEAWLEIKRLIDTTREHKGVFTILFHNSSLSETAEWKGWKIVYNKTIQYLSAQVQVD